MRKYLFSALFLLASLQAAHADANHGPFSANDLHQMCTSKYDVDYGYCAGYVSAVAHELLTQPVSGSRACNHVNVKSQQLVDTFNSWTELFPERLGDDAEAAVAASLARAFPCPQ